MAAQFTFTSVPSCRIAIVVLEESPEPFTTLDGIMRPLTVIGRRYQYHIPLALMGAFLVIMGSIHGERMPQRALSKQDQARQTLLFHRAYPPLGVGIQIGRPRRERHTLHSSIINDPLKGRTELPIAVVDKVVAW